MPPNEHKLTKLRLGYLMIYSWVVCTIVRRKECNSHKRPNCTELNIWLTPWHHVQGKMTIGLKDWSSFVEFDWFACFLWLQVDNMSIKPNKRILVHWLITCEGSLHWSQAHCSLHFSARFLGERTWFWTKKCTNLFRNIVKTLFHGFMVFILQF